MRGEQVPNMRAKNSKTSSFQKRQQARPSLVDIHHTILTAFTA